MLGTVGEGRWGAGRGGGRVATKLARVGVAVPMDNHADCARWPDRARAGPCGRPARAGRPRHADSHLSCTTRPSKGPALTRTADTGGGAGPGLGALSHTQTEAPCAARHVTFFVGEVDERALAPPSADAPDGAGAPAPGPDRLFVAAPAARQSHVDACASFLQRTFTFYQVGHRGARPASPSALTRPWPPGHRAIWAWLFPFRRVASSLPTARRGL
jgi:hypothetical protein